jgi:hypothetical protein
MGGGGAGKTVLLTASSTVLSALGRGKPVRDPHRHLARGPCCRCAAAGFVFRRGALRLALGVRERGVRYASTPAVARRDHRSRAPLLSWWDCRRGQSASPLSGGMKRVGIARALVTEARGGLRQARPGSTDQCPAGGETHRGAAQGRVRPGHRGLPTSSSPRWCPPDGHPPPGRFAEVGTPAAVAFGNRTCGASGRRAREE